MSKWFMNKSRPVGGLRSHTLVALAVSIVTIVTGIVVARAAPAQAAPWLQPFGSDGHDSATNAAADATGVVVVGWSTDAFAGQPFAGGPQDAFVVRYNAIGVAVWTREFGTSGLDVATGVAIGGDGQVLVVGQVGGALAGSPSSPFDAFVREYNTTGSVQWTRQFGAGGSSATSAMSVAVDAAGAVYVAGWVYGALPGATPAGQGDAFVRKYDSSGTELWTRQFGGADHDQAITVKVDAAGDVYVAGQIDQRSGDAGTTVVRKYRPGGDLVWIRTLGQPADETIAVTIDAAGAIYMVGNGFSANRAHDHSEGQAESNHAGEPFVRKYDPSGTEVWTSLLPGGRTDVATNLAVDSAGTTVYVVGYKSKGMGQGNPDFRSVAFVRSFDASRGNPGSIRQFPSAGYTRGTAVAVGSLGVSYMVGWTRGALPGTSILGLTDAFVAEG
jgi:hypothetical protein